MRCLPTRRSTPIGAASPTSRRWRSTRPNRSKHSLERSPTGRIVTRPGRLSALMRSRLVLERTFKTRSSFAWRRMPAFAAESSSPYGGATSISRAGRSLFAAHSPATWRFVRPRAAAHARCRFRPRPLPLWSASAAGASSPDPTITSSPIGSGVDWIPRRCVAASNRARDAAGLEPLKFHALRHSYGSLLVAGGIDLPSVKAAMGYSRITTTERYLHARPAGELAARFTRALSGIAIPAAV